MPKFPEVIHGKNMLVRSVPADVQAMLIKKLKADSDLCRCTRSQDHSLFAIVRAWDEALAPDADHLVLCYRGQTYQVPAYGIEFSGSDMVLTVRLPITSPLGAVLNYERVKSSGS